jgi:hypothetical protein
MHKFRKMARTFVVVQRDARQIWHLILLGLANLLLEVSVPGLENVCHTRNDSSTTSLLRPYRLGHYNLPCVHWEQRERAATSPPSFIDSGRVLVLPLPAAFAPLRVLAVFGRDKLMFARNPILEQTRFGSEPAI